MTGHCTVAASTNPNQICRADSPALAVENGYLCAGHRRKLDQIIGELNAAVSLLLAHRIPGTAALNAVRVSGGGDEMPAPLRLGHLDLADRIGDIAGCWARLAAEDLHLQVPVGLPLASAFLQIHLDWLCEQPWVSDLYEEIVEVHGQAHQTVPWKQGRRRLPTRHIVEAGGCGALAVFQDDGDDNGYCDSRGGGCGSAIAAADLARWLGRESA